MYIDSGSILRDACAGWDGGDKKIWENYTSFNGLTTFSYLAMATRRRGEALRDGNVISRMIKRFDKDPRGTEETEGKEQDRGKGSRSSCGRVTGWDSSDGRRRRRRRREIRLKMRLLSERFAKLAW